MSGAQETDAKQLCPGLISPLFSFILNAENNPEKEILTMLTETIMLPMTDGVKLDTTIFWPEGAGPFPTVLMRSCYPNHLPFRAKLAEGFTKEGFAFVFQWCRGIAPSEGVWNPNVNERGD
ncbi:CocE/NonD family hydrolase, partial [Vibrio sp. FNV 38]|nr:CocE/NonD family hydrolase [Vibrio sp. FNV 38]